MLKQKINQLIAKYQSVIDEANALAANTMLDDEDTRHNNSVISEYEDRIRDLRLLLMEESNIQNLMKHKYQIIRFYRKSGRKKVIRKGLSLAEAQQWCRRPDTRKEGVWFDGYDEM